jgi:hypothetical protein
MGPTHSDPVHTIALRDSRPAGHLQRRPITASMGGTAPNSQSGNRWPESPDRVEVDMVRGGNDGQQVARSIAQEHALGEPVARQAAHLRRSRCRRRAAVRHDVRFDSCPVQVGCELSGHGHGRSPFRAVEGTRSASMRFVPRWLNGAANGKASLRPVLAKRPEPSVRPYRRRSSVWAMRGSSLLTGSSRASGRAPGARPTMSVHHAQ